MINDLHVLGIAYEERLGIAYEERLSWLLRGKGINACSFSTSLPLSVVGSYHIVREAQPDLRYSSITSDGIMELVNSTGEKKNSW